MLGAASSSDWSNIIAAVIGVSLTSIVAVIAYIVKTELNRLTTQIDKNSKHLDSVIATMWPLIWRVNSIEDFLESESQYHPPRILGEAETRFRGKVED